MKRIQQALRLALLAALVAAAGTSALAAPPRAPAAGAGHGPVTLEQCSWDRPGADPFMGDVVAAVDRYTDIAPDVRKRLQARMVKRAYDDVVVIKQASITGKGRYGATIRDMHFGADRLCRSVSRARWAESAQERGLVYCDSGQCILVPTVCRNVSRITRAEVADEHIVAPPEAPLAAEDAVPPLAAALLAPVADALAPAPSVLAEAPEEAASPSFAGAAGFGGGGGFVNTGFGGAGSGTSGGGGMVSAAPATPEGPVTPVPEPETWLLFLAGLAVTARWARRHGAILRG